MPEFLSGWTSQQILGAASIAGLVLLGLGSEPVKRAAAWAMSKMRGVTPTTTQPRSLLEILGELELRRATLEDEIKRIDQLLGIKDDYLRTLDETAGTEIDPE